MNNDQAAVILHAIEQEKRRRKGKMRRISRELNIRNQMRNKQAKAITGRNRPTERKALANVGEFDKAALEAARLERSHGHKVNPMPNLEKPEREPLTPELALAAANDREKLASARHDSRQSAARREREEKALRKARVARKVAELKRQQLAQDE